MWTLVVVLSLALGIGANTAIFSAINGLVLQTLPVDHPETLVRLQWAGENDMGTDFSEYGATAREGNSFVRTTFPYRIYEEFRRANQTLDDLFACAPQGQVNVVSGDRAELATSLIASGNYFIVLGVHAAVGRTFTPDDDRPGAPAVAVLSHGYWVRRFGGDAGVVGRVMTINNMPVTIVGVTPPSFTGVQQVVTDAREITLPLSLDPQFAGASTRRPDGSMTPPRLEQPTTWWLQIVGRLKPGVTAEQVEGNLAGVFQQSARDGWRMYFGALPERDRTAERYQHRTNVPQLRVRSGSRGVYDVTPDTYRSIALLTVVVALVLFIVCANVANLLLSRAASRQREISVRVSLGASRARLIRQLLTESVLLASLGGAAGLLLAYWGRALLPGNLGTSPIDWRVFGFVAALTLMTGVIFGIAPALRASRVDIAGGLKDGGRGVAGGRSRLGKALLVVQVATSLVLLIGAGLFLRTVQNLRRVDVGFATENLLLVPVNPAMNRYELPRVLSLYTEMLQRLAAAPGVRAAALSNPPLLSGGMSTTNFFVQGRPAPPRSRENVREGGQNNIYRVVVSPSFFETMGMRVSDGRGLTDRDTQTAPKVAVINEQAVRKFFPNERAIGQRFGQTAETSGETEIVGVLRDAKYNSLRDDAPPTMYVSYRQAWGPGRVVGVTFELRTTLDPMKVVPAVRETIRQIDPNLPILNISTQTDQIERRFAQEKVFAQAYAWFGGLALVVASIGLFGLMSYTVARRTNEIGIRMALGADRRTVLAMVMRESLVLVVVGVVLGVASALAAGRLVESLLFGLAATDALTLAGAVIVMFAVSAVAGYLPARTAARVNPMIALRYE